MNTKSEMLSVAEALARVTGGFELIASEHIGLSEALGRVLAEDVAARGDDLRRADGRVVHGRLRGAGGRCPNRSNNANADWGVAGWWQV